MADSLVFVSDFEMFKVARKNSVRAFILTDKLHQECKEFYSSDLSVWSTSSIHLAMANLLFLFDLKAQYTLHEIHPKAFVAPTAKIGKNVSIGAGAFIGDHAIIGDNTIIHPLVSIGAFCSVGTNCVVASNTTIGSDGFGFFTDKTGTHHKIPQIGNVIIEDNCEIGANCAIDRATLTSTKIGKGTKLDNHCHIAHNVEIGENSIIAAGFIVAGSTKIGKNFMASGSVHVLGHLEIADNVIMTARSGTLKSITAPGMYGGYPLESHKESVKTHVTIPQIKSLRIQVNRILKHLNLKEGQ
jgi:UDP-3-O-[3-hydroxymyristoyl] glucosamine N-acyltransferase